MYGFTSLILYATARTLDSKYQYSALKIGLVSVSYGVGMDPCLPPSLSSFICAKVVLLVVYWGGDGQTTYLLS